MRRGEQNEELIERALGHRVRRRILRWAADRGEAATPRVISIALDHPLPQITYHVRRLRDAGLLDETGRLPVSGGAEHLYRLNPKAAYLQQVAKVLDVTG